MARYGSWRTIAEPSGKRVLCRCVCGTEKEVLIGNLKSGKTTSCGCKKTETNRGKMLEYWRKQRLL